MRGSETAIRGTGADETYFEREREREAEIARQKTDRYRGGGSAPDLTGKTVVVVDDGVATGSTVRACLETLGDSGGPGSCWRFPSDRPTPFAS